MNDQAMSACPVCDKLLPIEDIETHVNKCLFLKSLNPTQPLPSLNRTQSTPKRKSDPLESPTGKRSASLNDYQASSTSVYQPNKNKSLPGESRVPLAEVLRPSSLDDFVGQCHIFGKDKIFRQLLESNKVPSMILWGPPGCGKTSLANIIQQACRKHGDCRFVKLSASVAGVSDVKEAVSIARNDANTLRRHTVLFMDEIHRFNKLQQDIFLPHVESGLITLLGATTENPSFSLNSALLSRCKVVVLEKLSTENLLQLLQRAAVHFSAKVVESEENIASNNSGLYVCESVLQWLAEMSDGDARVCLNSFQLAVESGLSSNVSSSRIITLDDIKDGIKRSHLLYDRKGDEHYNIISALHKSIRAGHDSAALYWLTRMLEGGEDPLYVARRLVRAAAEDVGLVDPMALTMAVSAMQGCQLIGMPECNVLLAQVAIYLARAQKSREVDIAMARAKQCVLSHKGALPGVPLHLRNAPTRLMKDLGYGRGYNMRDRASSGLSYMPEGMESISFFD